MTNESMPQVRIRLRGDGWSYQLFTNDNDPLQFESDSTTYATQGEAARAGHEAKQAFIRRMGAAR
jgi:hypothetical protein